MNFFYYTEYDVSRMARIICIPISQVDGTVQNTSEIPHSPMWDIIKKDFIPKGIGNNPTKKIGKSIIGSAKSSVTLSTTPFIIPHSKASELTEFEIEEIIGHFLTEYSNYFSKEIIAHRHIYIEIPETANHICFIYTVVLGEEAASKVRLKSNEGLFQ